MKKQPIKSLHCLVLSEEKKNTENQQTDISLPHLLLSKKLTQSDKHSAEVLSVSFAKLTDKGYQSPEACGNAHQ